MPWHAIDAVDDALDATRSFLFPFDWGRWARLAVIVLFLGGGGNPLNYTTNLPTSGTPAGDPPLPPGSSNLVLGAAVVAAALALVIVVVAAVMRFVFLDALRTDEVRIRAPFRRRFGKGVRFLVFNVGVGLLVVASLVMVVVALTTGGLALFETVQSPNLRVGLGVLGSLLLGLFALAAGVAVISFFHFTRAFVAPAMIADDAGVIRAWGSFWRVLRQNRGQFGVYLLARLVIEVAVGLASGLVALIAGGIVVAGGVILGVVVSVAFGGFSAVTNSLLGVGLLAFIGFLTLATLLAGVVLPVRILAKSFVVSYELTVLGRLAPDLDLLANVGSRRDVAEHGRPPEESTEEAATGAEQAGGFEFGHVESEEGSAEAGGAASTREESSTGPSESSHAAVDEDGKSNESPGNVESDGNDDGDESDEGDESANSGIPYWKDP